MLFPAYYVGSTKLPLTSIFHMFSGEDNAEYIEHER